MDGFFKDVLGRWFGFFGLCWIVFDSREVSGRVFIGICRRVVRISCMGFKRLGVYVIIVCFIWVVVFLVLLFWFSIFKSLEFSF